MVGELITLPLRLSARTASFFLRQTEELVRRAVTIATPPMPTAPSPGPQETEHATAPAATERPSPAPTRRPAPERAAARTLRTEDRGPFPTTPTHVSEEPTIVEELAEAGAEEGAGAQVTVDEPWDGYAHMNANDVITRLGEASQAELAAVSLYESAHQARQTVLSAVERQLELASRGGSPD